MILHWGADMNSVDVEAAGRQGILVTKTPDANASAVSELAVMTRLAVGRKFLYHTESLHSGIWRKSTFLNNSTCLLGKLVGVVGGGKLAARWRTKY